MDLYSKKMGPTPGWRRVALVCASLASFMPARADAQAPAEEPAPPQQPDAAEPAAPEAMADAPEQTEPEETGVAGAEPPEAEAAPESDVVVDSGGGLFEEAAAAPGSVVGEGDADRAPGPARGFELNGYARGDVFVGKADHSDRAVLRAGYGELALQFRAHRERFGDAFAETRFRYGQQGEENDLFIDLREAYVNAYLGPLDLRLGKQIVVWGRADAFNPTNNITPIDLRIRSPLEDDRRVGNIGARAFLNFQPVRIEGVWMPLYLATEFPPLELPSGVVFGAPNYPAPEIQEGLGAGRIHLELPSFEASASYLYGYALLPGLALQSWDYGLDAGVVIERRPYKHQVIGLDFSTAISDLFALRGEAAYRIPDDEEAYRTPRPEFNYVLGIDKTFGNLSVIAQYVGKYVEDWQAAAGNEPPLDVQTRLGGLDDAQFMDDPALFGDIESEITTELAHNNQILFQQTKEIQHTASLRLEWLTLHDTLSISALGAYNFSTEEWIVYPKITYQFSDGMSGSVGAEIYNGPEDTLLDYLDQQLTAGYAELRFSF
jgi:hypothetical protein